MGLALRRLISASPSRLFNFSSLGERVAWVEPLPSPEPIGPPRSEKKKSKSVTRRQDQSQFINLSLRHIKTELEFHCEGLFVRESRDGQWNRRQGRAKAPPASPAERRGLCVQTHTMIMSSSAPRIVAEGSAKGRADKGTSEEQTAILQADHALTTTDSSTDVCCGSALTSGKLQPNPDDREER